MNRTKLPALIVTAMLLLTAVASVPVAAAEESVAVETLEPTDVSEDGATLHGNVTALENASDATVWFEYWAQGDQEDATETEELTANGTFSLEIEDLTPDTTYVVRAHAETENTSDTGYQVTFTTYDADAEFDVDTHEASDVTNDSATLDGALSGLGGEDEAVVWFEYWVQGDEANRTETATETLDEPGEFDAEIDGLDNETTYVFEAYAEANGTVVTGSESTFTTGLSSDESTEPTYDGDGPFGRWLSAIIHNIAPQDWAGDMPFGQWLSEIVTANNPGAEHRSDRANPGGHGPENAGKSDDDGHGSPDHAGGSHDDRGAPDHAKGGQDEAKDDDHDGDDHEDDELDVAVDGDVEANATVTVTVTDDGEPVEGANVSLNGEAVGTTDADGQLEVTLPDDLGDEVELSVEADDAEGEWEFEADDE